MYLKTRFVLVCLIMSLSSISLSQIPNYIPTQNLEGWWPFNGNAIDESGSGNNGTISGATFAVDRFGNANKALSFDGINDFVSTNYFGIPQSNSRTVALWFKTSSSNEICALTYGGYPVSTPSNAGTYFNCSLNFGGVGINGNTGYSAVTYTGLDPVNDGNWHSCIWVLDDEDGPATQDIKIYYDGLLLTTVVNNFFEEILINTFTGINALKIGTSYEDAHPFNGSIDDVGIWSRALNFEEIQQIFNAPNCFNSPIITPSVSPQMTGNTAIFTATSSNPVDSYIWQSDLGQGFQTLFDFGAYSGTTSNLLSVSNVQIQNHLQRIRVITLSGQCTDTSEIAHIQILDTCISNITLYDTLLVSVTDTLFINTTVSDINSISIQNVMKLYPNPTNSHLTIDYGNFEIMNGYSLSIINTNGQTVFSSLINTETSYITLSNWGGPGLYFVYLIDPENNIIETKKIILQ